MGDEGRHGIEVRDVERTVEAFWGLGGQVTVLPGATVVHSSAAPDHPLGNVVCRVRSDDPAVLDVVLRSEVGPGRHRPDRVCVDADTPPGAEAHLVLRDWQLETRLALVLAGSVPVAAPEPVLRPAASDDDWVAIAGLFRIDHAEEDARAGVAPRPVAATRSAVDLRRSLGPEATYFVAERDGRPFACIAAWASPDGIGLIEDVFVHPDARGAGVATTMLRHAVGHVRGHGAGDVVICAEVDDTPKHLYAGFGFRPATVLRSYVRPAGAAPPSRAG